MTRKLRIKGTDIYVKFLDASSNGISCQYLNGEHEGAYTIIAGDCLVEENPNDDLFKNTLKASDLFKNTFKAAIDMTNSYHDINIETLEEISKLMAETIKR